MSLCKHPNLLTVYGSFVHTHKLYIVAPFLSAGKISYPPFFFPITFHFYFQGKENGN